MNKQFLKQNMNGEILVPTILAFTVAFSMAFPGASTAQERGALEHPELVGGPVVSPATQEQFGLLTLVNPEGSCSASMLNDYWAITAAHCVYSPTTNLPIPASQITLTANWPSNHKSAQAIKVVAYSSGLAAPDDIALIQMGLYDFTRAGTEQKLESTSPAGNSTITAYGRGLSVFASGLGSTATPSSGDGQYRSAAFNIYGVTQGGATYSLPGSTPRGISIAAGDSGGPSYIQDWDNPLSINRKLEWQLLGVHSHCNTTCATGKDCSAANPWQWVTATSACTDAAVFPHQDSILQTIQEIPQSRDFVGTFAQTPANYQPLWIYVVKDDGVLLWYRQDSTSAQWQGPSEVGTGWQTMADIIPAGGNRLYALTSTGSLVWYQHNGFNDGAFDWNGPVQVGTGWNSFSKIFSGGDGIVYAIKEDGTLLWYRNVDYATGGRTWEGPNVVGYGWGQFKDIFSMGNGIIYGVQQDGTLLWYNHTGYATGQFQWTGPYTVGTGWQNFTRIIPAGGGVILAIQPDGALLWYKHQNYAVGVSTTKVGAYTERAHAIWQYGGQIGSGWAGFNKVFALLPSTPEAPR